MAFILLYAEKMQALASTPNGLKQTLNSSHKSLVRKQLQNRLWQECHARSLQQPRLRTRHFFLSTLLFVERILFALDRNYVQRPGTRTLVLFATRINLL